MPQTDATRVQFWAGTRAEYTAIGVKESNWIYFITDENTLYRGGQPFAQDIEKLLSFSNTAPASASIGQRYFNSTSKKIYTYGASGWSNPEDPAVNRVYFNLDASTLYTWSDTKNVYVGDGATTGGVIVNSDLYTQVTALAANVQIIIDGQVPVQGTYACGIWTPHHDNVTTFGAWTP